MNIEVKHISGLPKRGFKKGVGEHEGVVAHETANWNAGALAHFRYFRRSWKNIGAFVHYFVDEKTIIETASTNYRAWGAGTYANDRFLHVELCRNRNKEDFKTTYNKYVKLIAKLLNDQKLGIDSLYTHNEIRLKFGGTNHTDPDAYLKHHGVTISQFKKDVKKHLNKKTTVTYNKMLNRKDQGEDVKQLQRDLHTLGYKKIVGTIDGIFGKMTEAGVKAFQKDHSLTVDGIAGQNTFKALKEALENLRQRKLEEKRKKEKEEALRSEFMIMGKTKLHISQLIALAKNRNENFNEEIANLFVNIADIYNIRGDLAFLQSCLETNFYKFGGDVKADQNNFGGIGATGGGVAGNSFKTIEDGVTVNIQHLHAYATKKPLPKGVIKIDPRFDLVQKGIAPSFYDLGGGKWAADPDYFSKIKKLYNEAKALPVIEKDYIYKVEIYKGEDKEKAYNIARQAVKNGFGVYIAKHEKK